MCTYDEATIIYFACHMPPFGVQGYKIAKASDPVLSLIHISEPTRP